MFERFTEKARRAVFFARYEASQYGNSYIETEHLLLGLWREDHTLRGLLKDTGFDSEIRAEIERVVVRRERISTSVEMPLSAESKKALLCAVEEAERLGQRHVGTEHMLLGLLDVEGSLGAQIVKARGVTPEAFRVKMAKRPVAVSGAVPTRPSLPVLEEFLQGLKWYNSEQLMPYFAKNARFVDVFGKCWTHDEIAKNFATLLLPYAKKNATYLVEDTLIDSRAHLVALVLWKNALVASMERVWMHRMTVVIVPDGENWAILSIQVTPVQP